LHCLEYGAPPDAVDDYLRMAESTCSKTDYMFCRALIEVFAADYLRAPMADDTARILAQMSPQGFLGSSEASTACSGVGKIAFLLCKGCTRGIKVSAMSFFRRWQTMISRFGMLFFGMAGTHNDINVLQRSPVFVRLAEGQAPAVNFGFNGHTYNKGYYLADGIYPTYATFVKTISSPSNEMEVYLPGSSTQGC
jgi:hypothetical protein